MQKAAQPDFLCSKRRLSLTENIGFLSFYEILRKKKLI